jgi:DNA-binding LacI/PurR family transcriptional regulator
MMLGDMSDQPRLVDDLRGSMIPVVALWEGSKPDGIASVSVDNHAGIRAVMNHVTELGHRRIAFLAGRRLGDIREREEAYLEAMADLGQQVPDGYLQYASNDPTGGALALAAVLELPERPTAVVASTDVLAMGVLFEANRRGLRVPDDLSVTGFDDIPLAAFSIPTLTTVRMPTREMVAAAVAMLIDGQLDPADPAGWPRPILAPSLVVRASTGPVAAGA